MKSFSRQSKCYDTRAYRDNRTDAYRRSCSTPFRREKLPEIMRGLGKGISEFKKGVKEVTDIPEQTE